MVTEPGPGKKRCVTLICTLLLTISACLFVFKLDSFYLTIQMRAAKGRAKAWLMEVGSRERRRCRGPQQKQRKPPRPKAAPCCIYPLLRDVCEVTKAAAAAIAGEMTE